jgi:hypothetical protein
MAPRACNHWNIGVERQKTPKQVGRVVGSKVRSGRNPRKNNEEEECDHPLAENVGVVRAERTDSNAEEKTCAEREANLRQIGRHTV